MKKVTLFIVLLLICLMGETTKPFKELNIMVNGVKTVSPLFYDESTIPVLKVDNSLAFNLGVENHVKRFFYPEIETAIITNNNLYISTSYRFKTRGAMGTVLKVIPRNINVSIMTGLKLGYQETGRNFYGTTVYRLQGVGFTSSSDTVVFPTNIDNDSYFDDNSILVYQPFSFKQFGAIQNSFCFNIKRFSLTCNMLLWIAQAPNFEKITVLDSAYEKFETEEWLGGDGEEYHAAYLLHVPEEFTLYPELSLSLGFDIGTAIYNLKNRD